MNVTKYVIRGGAKLRGSVNISGAKNAAVAILPASLLVSGTCRVDNVPDISDVNILLEILASMGAKVRRLSRTEIEIDATQVRSCTPPEELVGRIRASYGSYNQRDVIASAQLPFSDEFKVSAALARYLRDGYGETLDWDGSNLNWGENLTWE